LLSDFAATLDGEGRVVEGLSAPCVGPAAAGAVRGAFLLDLLQFPEDTADALEVQEKLRRVLHGERDAFEHSYGITEDKQHRRFLLRGYSSPGKPGAVVIQLELRESATPASTQHAYLQALMNSTDGAVFAKDADGRYTHANQATAELFGLADAAAAVGKRDEELFAPDQARSLCEEDRRVLQEGQIVVQREELLRPANGSDARWISVTKEPVRNESGGIIGLVGIVRDVSEHRRLEARLRELTRCFVSFEPEPENNIRSVLRLCRHLLFASHSFYVRLQPNETLFPEPDDSSAEAVRLSVGDSLLRSLAIAPEERPVVLKNLVPSPEAKGAPAAQPGGTTLIAVPVQRQSHALGVLFVAMTWPYTPDDRDEELLLLCARAIAVEERRLASKRDLQESARRLNEAQRMARMGNWEWVPAGTTMFWSKELYQLFGIPPEVQPTMELWEELVHPQDLPHVKEVFAGINDEPASVSLHYRLRRKDGELRYFQTIIEADRDTAGCVRRLLGTTMDETDRLRADSVAHARVRLQATATLASGIAHDFNNLMACVLGNAELLQMDFSQESEAGQMLREIADSARQAGALAQKMLAFTQSGKAHPRITDVNEVVKEALDLSRSMVPAHVEVQTLLSKPLWQVETDPAQISHVVIDLLANAFESTESAGKVTVRTENVTLDEEMAHLPELTPGSYVAISVSDTGRGMDAETRARVFDPFFSTKFYGRGMSLAAAYGIVQRFGGSISVHSAVGEGATFRLYLPAAEPVASASADGGDLPAGTETVLVVDDEPMVLAVTGKLLERLGYSVLTAENGKEAVGVAKKHKGPVDVILLDMCMPVMDGATAFPLLRKTRPNAPIILCSGYDANYRVEELLKEGGAAFLQKPYRLEVLGPLVRKMLDG
jgi:PAS domain S-box-containing protein